MPAFLPACLCPHLSSPSTLGAAALTFSNVAGTRDSTLCVCVFLFSFRDGVAPIVVVVVVVVVDGAMDACDEVR